MNAIRSSLFMAYALVWSIFAAPPVIIGAILWSKRGRVPS